MNNDLLANVLSHILNYERVGKQQVVTKDNSKLIRKILSIMQDNGYLAGFKEIVDSKGNTLVIDLIGTINKCNVIKPRYQIGKDEFERYEKRFLPSKDFGFLVVSTSKGLMTHIEAKKLGVGGVLVAFCY